MNGDTGYKIAEYYEGARNSRADDWNDVAKCMELVQRLLRGIVVGDDEQRPSCRDTLRRDSPPLELVGLIREIQPGGGNRFAVRIVKHYVPCLGFCADGLYLNRLPG